MKNFKYLFLFILMVSFCVQPAVFAQEEEAEAAAVSDYQKLVAFGVIEDEADLISEQVLRGDFARFVIKISGIDAASVAGGQLPFSDVSANDKNYEYIRAAYTLGLINGYSETEFGPEEPIMFQQAVKILLNVIGYEPIAAQKGGYPTGYLLTASDTGVLKGIGSINQQATLSAKIAARLLLNALDTEILVQESVGETYKYTTIKGQTLLSEKLDIYRITGIMQSNMFSSLDGDSTVGTDRVQIGSGIYETGLTDAADYLGCNVEAYYREDKTDNVNILVYAGLAENKNDVVTVSYKDIETGAVTKDSFVYREAESGKKANLKIDRVATLLLNGKQKSLNIEDLCPEVGEVTLIDNDMDDSYEVIKVTSYREVVVDSVSTITYTIADKLGGGSIDLDPDEKDDTVIIRKDGKTASLSDIKAWNTILYAESEGDGKKLKRLEVSSSSITGTIEATSEDGIVIGGTFYDVRKELLNKLQVGVSGTFYLDILGRVIEKQTEKPVVYGYLYKIHQEVMGDVQVKIYTENDRWVTLDVMSKLEFNRVSGSKASDLMSGNPLWNDKGEFMPQLVTYRVNDEGKVSMLNLASDVTGFTDDKVQESIDNNVFRLSMNLASSQYRANTNSFGPDVYMDSTTVLFMVPTDAEADEKDFSISNLSDLISDQSYKNIKVYDMNESSLARVCVMESVSGTVPYTNDFMVVYGTGEAVNDDGEPSCMIRGMYKGYSISAYTKNKEMMKDELKAGDIIQFNLNNDGYIESYRLVYKFTPDAGQKFALNGPYSTSAIIAGQVRYVDAAAGRLVLDSTSKLTLDIVKMSPAVYLYDSEANILKPGSVSDIEKGMYICGRFSYLRAQIIIVFAK